LHAVAPQNDSSSGAEEEAPIDKQPGKKPKKVGAFFNANSALQHKHNMTEYGLPFLGGLPQHLVDLFTFTALPRT